MDTSWFKSLFGKDIKASLKDIATHRVTADTFVLSGGRFIASAVGFLIGMLVARALKPADFGIFSVAMAVFEVAVVFTEIGIGISLVRFVPMFSIKDKSRADYYLKVGFWLLVGSAVIVTSIGLFLSPVIAERLYQKPQLSYPVALGFLAVFGGILWSYFLYSLHARERFKPYAVFRVIIGLVKLALIGLLIYFAALTINNVLMLYILLPVVGFVVGIIYIRTPLIKARGDFKDTFSSLINFSKWMFLIDFFLMLSNRIDLLILGRYVKDEVLGHYSMAYYMISMFTILTSSLVNVLLPHVSKFNSMAQIKAYVRKIPKITFLCAVALLPIIFIMGPIINLLVGPEYNPSIVFFQIMFFGFLVTFIIDPIYLVAYSVNKPRVLSFLCIVRLILSAGINIVLIPRYGAMGAAIASVSTNFLVAAVGVTLIYKYIYKMEEFSV